MSHWFYCQFCRQWNKAAPPIGENNFCPLCGNLFATIKPYADSVPANLEKKQSAQMQKRKTDDMLDRPETGKPGKLCETDEVSAASETPDEESTLITEEISQIVENTVIPDENKTPNDGERGGESALIEAAADSKNQESFESQAEETVVAPEMREPLEVQALSDMPDEAEPPETVNPPAATAALDQEEGIVPSNESEANDLSDTDEIGDIPEKSESAEDVTTGENIETGTLFEEDMTEKIENLPETAETDEVGEESAGIEMAEDSNKLESFEAQPEEAVETSEMLETLEAQASSDIPDKAEASETFITPKVYITFDKQEGTDTPAASDVYDVSDATEMADSPISEASDSNNPDPLGIIGSDTSKLQDTSSPPDHIGDSESPGSTETVVIHKTAEDKEELNISKPARSGKNKKMTRTFEPFIIRQRRLKKMR